MLKKTNTAEKGKPAFKLENKGTIRTKRPIYIAQDLSWTYGEDVVVYDVREKSPFVSFYIVASAGSDRRLKALEAQAKDSLWDNFFDLDHVEGKNDSNWILMDAKQIVIQLFTKEERKRVNFDELYADCPHKIVVAEKEPDYKKRKKPESQMN